MDNATRSERSRKAVLEAALVIIARDGAGRLTLDAIAKQCGISKGGVMHQFPTKEAVLKTLLERQIAYFESDAHDIAKSGKEQLQPHLRAQIDRLREALATPRSVVFAVLGAAAQEPGLLGATREVNAKKIRLIKGETGDPDLAILRWVSAWGLVLTSQLGLSPLSKDDRERLFDRLLDDEQWRSLAKPKKRVAALKSTKGRRSAHS